MIYYTYTQFGCSAPGPLMYINMIFVIFTEHTTYTHINETKNLKLEQLSIQDVENATIHKVNEKKKLKNKNNIIN